jgi:hypothetical protein
MATVKPKQKNSEEFDRSTLEGIQKTWHPTATYPQLPKNLAPMTKIGLAAQTAFLTRRSVQVYGPPGIAKSALARVEIPLIMSGLIPGVTEDDVEVVVLNLTNIGPDDLISAAPVRVSSLDQLTKDQTDSAVEIILKDMIADVIKVSSRPVRFLVCDDRMQSLGLVKNATMQLMNDLTLGSFDLRELGFVGALFLDNSSLSETMNLVEDLAQADRAITFEVTDSDLGIAAKVFLAGKYARFGDLTAIFEERDSLPRELRYILNWRVLDHVLYNIAHDLPPVWGLPVTDDWKYTFLDTTSGGKTVMRTKEVFAKFSAALGKPYLETAKHPMHKLLDVVLKCSCEVCANHQSSVRIIGPQGVGKTEIAKAYVNDIGAENVYLSIPVTDFDALAAPVPTSDGELRILLAEKLRNSRPKVVIEDEFSRAKDAFTHIRAMELNLDHSLASVKIPALKAVIALENPGEILGRKTDGARALNLTQASRFTSTIFIDSTDVPFYEWLTNELPKKMAEEHPGIYGHRIEEISQVAELFCEWHRSDIDSDGRQWISPRALERMIRVHFAGAPLENAKVWLGPGEFAPVPLSGLIARLENRPMTGLKDLSANLDSWIDRLKRSSETSEEGTADSDLVHMAFTNAELSQLWKNVHTVVELVKYLPPRFRATYFIDQDKDRQRFWMAALGASTGRLTFKSVLDTGVSANALTKGESEDILELVKKRSA